MVRLKNEWAVLRAWKRSAKWGHPDSNRSTHLLAVAKLTELRGGAGGTAANGAAGTGAACTLGASMARCDSNPCRSTKFPMACNGRW